MEHHYYASTIHGWAVADTKEDAIKRAANFVGHSTLKRSLPKGLAMVVCCVGLPQAAHYTISDYVPHLIKKEDGVNEARKGELVPVTELEHVRLLNMKGKTGPFDSK